MKSIKRKLTISWSTWQYVDRYANEILDAPHYWFIMLQEGEKW